MCSRKLNPRILMRPYGCTLGLERPRKLNRKNFPSDQSEKIGALENFPLYGITCIYIHIRTKATVWLVLPIGKPVVIGMGGVESSSNRGTNSVVTPGVEFKERKGSQPSIQQ